MNQLLQGDVGSGKTVVALRAMLQVVAGSGQAVLLAPTEVLAGQHHQTIAKLLEAAELRDRIGLELLTGSVAGKAKTELLAKVAEGGAGLVVGTHALLEGSVEFHDLGLVVVDEQHRFGVEQRDVLRTRGEVRPHVLVMTATPIPRTVAMTVFGDLEATTLEASPPGRQPVPTTWVNPVSHPGWLKRVWERVAEEARSGHGAFVICPTIEGSQTEDGAELWEDQAPAVMAFGGPASPGGRPNGGAGSGGAKRPLASVKATLEQLRNEPALAGLRLEALHGRMAPAEKDRVMGEFAAGQIDVLVATTVVEVGIDVPRATALVVLDADRFGLSQLHQLRGRVGRGEAQGVCLLVSTAEEGTPAATRLAAMERISSGFELANVDLLTRREGQVLGESQSGASSLRLVRLAHDADLILDARDAATALVRQDPDLVDHGALARAVERLLAGREDYLERG
jgi:ATP-dependent DNA helicase RecG